MRALGDLGVVSGNGAGNDDVVIHGGSFGNGGEPKLKVYIISIIIFKRTSGNFRCLPAAPNAPVSRDSDRRRSMPTAGERADDFRFATYADDLAAVREQHRMSGRLAQANDGLQRQARGRERQAGLEAGD